MTGRHVRATARTRRRFEVSGLVQGVGFRPFVYVTASELGLSGTVSNTSSGGSVVVEGDLDSVEIFGCRLVEDAPPLADVESVHGSEVACLGGTASPSSTRQAALGTRSPLLTSASATTAWQRCGTPRTGEASPMRAWVLLASTRFAGV